jgi:hypothetical protein
MSNPAACRSDLNSAACTFTGPNSGATPGICTQAAGYVANAEIEEVKELNDTDTDTYYYYDSGTDTDNMFYGSNWVSYMSEATKNVRILKYQRLNFGGTVDWAIDLQDYGNGVDDPEDDLPDMPYVPCDAQYKSLEELDAAATSIPDHCVTLYTVTVLKNLLNEAVTNYTSMMAGGYDKKFGIYAKAVASSAGKSLNDFIYNNGNKYFSCIVSEFSICCDQCKGAKQLSPTYCDYCFQGGCWKTCNIAGCNKRDESSLLEAREGGGPGGAGGGNTQELVTKQVNASEPCPPDYSKRGYGPNNPYVQSVYWKFVNESGFYADMTAKAGIPKDKTKIGRIDRGNNCAPSAKPGDDCWGTGIDYNIPVINGYSSSDVANPKDIVSKGLTQVQTLVPQIDSIVTQLKVDAWLGAGNELIDSISLPILMIASATENMAEVVQVANEISAEKAKAFILAFLSAIFLIIPIIGEVVGSIGEMASIGAILDLLGTAGSTAMDIYDLVKDPHNAPLAVMDLIFSPLALANLGTLQKAASIRRGMAEEDVARLGGKVSGRLKTIEKVKGTCAKSS